jgi:hypothetical protein
MKKLVLILTLVITQRVVAQIPVETLAGNKQVHYLSYWQKDIDSAGKFNFFSLTRFALDYKDKSYNNFAIEGQLTYQIKDWIGISAGGGYEGENFVPTIGINLSFASAKGDFFIEAYPTINLGKVKSFNLFGVAGYTPKFNSRWGLFSQLIFSTDLQIDKTSESPSRTILSLFTSHQQSTQLIRLGLNYKEKYQFGLGADLNQFFQNQGNFKNMGVFVRVNL